MKTVEIYMIDSVDGHSAGFIYEVKEHIAERLVEDGVARVVNYSRLNELKDAVKTIAAEVRDGIKAIEDNQRLSPIAKADDKREYIESCRQRVRDIDAEYKQEVEQLLQKAILKASAVKPKLDYDKDVVRVRVGHIRTGVAMSSSFTEALELLQKEAVVIDKNVASELLAHFTEIKRELDILGQNISPNDRARYIREVYGKLKEKALDKELMETMTEVDILQAIKKWGGITRPFEIATMNL